MKTARFQATADETKAAAALSLQDHQVQLGQVDLNSKLT
jgi:hypothetical protein